MRPNIRTLAAFGVAVLGLLLYGCPDKTVKIGVVLPLTGVDSVYGEAIRKGVEVAQAELASTSTPIEIEIVDSESKPEVAQQKVGEQYSSGALAVIGGVTSDDVKAVIEVVDRYDRVLLSPSASSPELTDISRYFYRICPSDFSAANRMADFASRTLKLESVVVVVERTYGQGIQKVFKDAFVNAGGEVLETIEVPPGTFDFSGLVDHVTSLEPAAVYLAAFAPATSALIKELRKQSFEGRILTTSAFTTSAIADVGQEAQDVVLTQLFFELDSEHAHVRKFVEGFEAKFSELPDLYAAYGYDSLRVLAAAVDGRPALASEVTKGLRDVSIAGFPGVTGSIQFDEKGDVQKFPRVYVIGEDLALYDYTERIERQQEELRRRREELRKRLDQLRDEAVSGGG